MKANSDGIKAFLYYIHERENIRIKKVSGTAWPWTKDEILQKYSFTNVRRMNDRTTQVFLKIYRANVKPGAYAQTLMNCATFRYVGTAAFAQDLGWQASWRAARVLRVVRERTRARLPVWTAAYCITNGGRSEPKEEVVVEYLEGLSAAFRDKLAPLLRFKSPSWAALGEEMMKIPGWGGTGFMVKEALLDFQLCYPGLFGDEETWSPIGPGARRGLNYLAGRAPDYAKPSHPWLEETMALRTLVAGVWKGWFPDSGAFTVSDAQWNCCEFAKYMKVKTGVGRPRSRYAPTIRRAGDEA